MSMRILGILFLARTLTPLHSLSDAFYRFSFKYIHCVPKCVSFLFVDISFALVSLALNLFETSYKTVFRNKIVQNGIAEMRQSERTKIIKNRMKN